LIRTIRTAFNDVMPRQPFRIDPHPGQGFLVDAAEHGVLQVTMASVSQTKPVISKGLGRVVTRLKSLLGLEDGIAASRDPASKPVLLLLYEDHAALPALQKIARGISERNVKLQAAAPLLLDPGGMANLQQALLRGRLDECMLIAASSAGASPSLSQAMQKLGQGYEGMRRVRQAYVELDGRLRLLADPDDGPIAGLSLSLQPAPDDPREMNDPGPDLGG